MLSDTCQENKLLLVENKRLNQKIKAMQETINFLTTKNSQLLLEKDINNINAYENTDKSDIPRIAAYIGEIETLKAKLSQSEQLCEQLYKIMEVEKYTGKKYNK